MLVYTKIIFENLKIGVDDAEAFELLFRWVYPRKEPQLDRFWKTKHSETQAFILDFRQDVYICRSGCDSKMGKLENWVTSTCMVYKFRRNTNYA